MILLSFASLKNKFKGIDILFTAAPSVILPQLSEFSRADWWRAMFDESLYSDVNATRAVIGRWP